MSETCFSNLPNFREVGGGKLVNRDGDKVKTGLLYRSSRTDFLTQEEVNTFLGFGFKSIIDMRNRSEFERADGAMLLGHHYEPFVLKRGNATPLKPSFRWGRKLKKDMKNAEKQKGDSGDSQFIGKRYMTNLLTRPFFLHMFYKVNIICRYLSLILLGIDWLIGSHFFAKYFAWHLINSQSMADQYVDMLEYGKYVIKDILQLMLSEDNLPTVIHCAHGKDRTGLVVAVVLACIDMDEEDIFADYAESEIGLAPIKKRVIKEIGKYGLDKKFSNAEAGTMQEVFREIKKRYGSWSNYIESTGFTKEEQEKLKEVLLVKQTASS